MVEFYPVDVDGLNKGDEISAERVQQILGISPAHPHLRLRSYELCRTIEKLMIDRGKPAIPRLMKDGSIRICTDSEAVAVQAQRQKRIRKQARKNLRRNLRQIDPTNLLPEQQRKWEREVQASCTIVQAINSTRKKVRAIPVERNTPLLFDESE